MSPCRISESISNFYSIFCICGLFKIHEIFASNSRNAFKKESVTISWTNVFQKYVCCSYFVLESVNRSLSQLVTVYPALPRQPAWDLFSKGRGIRNCFSSFPQPNAQVTHSYVLLWKDICHGVNFGYELTYCKTRSLGAPSGAQLLAEGPSGLLTSSFPPFGRSGRYVGPA